MVSFVQCHTRSLWWQKVIQDGSTTFISNGIPQFLILLKKKKKQGEEGSKPGGAESKHPTSYIAYDSSEVTKPRWIPN